MRRAGRLLCCALAGAACLVVSGPSQASRSGASGPVAEAAATPLQVTAREWWVGLSRARVRPGTVNVEFVNYGEDDHDLAITRSGGSTVARLGVLRPDERADASVKLRRGRYVFWCTISDHKRRGMRSVLTVKR